MDSKKALAVVISFPCSMFFIFILVMCLWEYRVWVGLSLLILLFLVVGVWMRGIITEQNLRIYRFNHHEETPLSNENIPMVLRPDMRERHNAGQQSYYQGYQQQ